MVSKHRLVCVLGSIAGLSVGLSAVSMAGADVAGVASSASQTGQAGQDFVRMLYKQPVRISLDGTRVAVQASDLATAEKIAADLGLGAVAANEVNGWFMVTLKGQLGAQDVRAVVQQLAAHPLVSFASPVFMDTYGPMWMTRAMNVAHNGDAAARIKAESTLRDGLKAQLSRAELLAGVDVYTPDTRNGFDLLEQANTLSMLDELRYCEPVWHITGSQGLVPTDPFFTTQWGLRNTGGNDCAAAGGGVAGVDLAATLAWDTTTGTNTVKIAVIDTGVDLTHPDLNLAPGYDATGGAGAGAPDTACDNHGTVVAGVITSKINNGIGGVGIAPNCVVVPVRMGINPVTAPCNVTFTTQLNWYADAMTFTATSGCKVSNSSLSAPQFATIDDAYNNSANSGVLHFGSTGNTGAASVSYPATLASVAGVGSLNRNNTRSGFSQFGPENDFLAPGELITTTDRLGALGVNTQDYACVSGTSFACPLAAGVAGLMFSVSPNSPKEDILATMKATCVDMGPAGFDNETGFGRLNAAAALAVIPPVNNICSNANQLTGASGTRNGTLINATNDGTANCGTSASNPDVWYRFVAPAPGTFSVNTCGTHDLGGTDLGLDSVISLHASCGSAALDCNDDSPMTCPGVQGIDRDSALSKTMTAGEVVLVRVSKWSGSQLKPFILNYSFALAGDACANAIDVSSGGTFQSDLRVAANEAAVTSCGEAGTNPDVWYKFTAGGCPTTLNVDTCGSNTAFGVDTVLGFYPSCGGNPIVCSDDSACGLDSQLSTNVNPGQTVYIRVSKFGIRPLERFNLNVSFSSRSNETCPTASPIATAVAQTYCTIGATTDGPTELACFDGVNSQVNADVWYSWTAPTNGRFAVRTCGSTFDTKVSIYGSTCPAAPGTVLGCGSADVTCVPNTSAVAQAIGALGTTYRIRVGGNGTASGSGVVTVFCAPDFNWSGSVTIQDIFDFLNAWFGASPRTDFNGVAGITIQDIFDFLNAWFAGC